MVKKTGEVHILSPIFFRGSQRRIWALKNPEEVMKMGIKTGDKITIEHVNFKVEYATLIANPICFILKLRMTTV